SSQRFDSIAQAVTSMMEIVKLHCNKYQTINFLIVNRDNREALGCRVNPFVKSLKSPCSKTPFSTSQHQEVDLTASFTIVLLIRRAFIN
ncbi:6237_t:CDS:1, partial [Acaulospora morrowiae]